MTWVRCKKKQGFRCTYWTGRGASGICWNQATSVTSDHNDARCPRHPKDRP